MNEYWTTNTTYGDVEINYIITKTDKEITYGYAQEIC